MLHIKLKGIEQWTDAKAWQKQDINNTNDPQQKYRVGTVSKNILLEGLNRFHGANLTLSSDVDHSQIVWETVNANALRHLVGIHATVKKIGRYM